MRRIINYIRQCFCKHDYYVDEMVEQKGFLWNITQGTIQPNMKVKVYVYCKRCGYHTNYWKGENE